MTQPTEPQRHQLAMCLESNANSGYPSTVYERKGDYLLATEYEHGFTRISVCPNGGTKSFGSTPINFQWKEIVAIPAIPADVRKKLVAKLGLILTVAVTETDEAMRVPTAYYSEWPEE